MRMKNWMIIVGMFVCRVSISQDIHFSQFDVFQPKVNPAYAGFMKESYRFSVINRTQWKAISTPFRTLGVQAESGNTLNVKGLGLGLTFLSDVAGDSKFTTNNLSFSAGFHKKLFETRSSIGLAGQISFVQQSIDYSNLSYNNQYNGLFFDPSLNHKETFAVDNLSYMDFALGAVYEYRISKKESLTLGLATYNLSTSKVSLLNDDAVDLDSRTTISGLLDKKINSKISILPTFIWSVQGSLKEIVIGSRARKTLSDKMADYKALYGGLYWRTNDALYLVLGMDYNEWYGGISYDINLSSLSKASNARGGIELVLVYKIMKFDKNLKTFKSCPVYF
ncbi:MAG: type IX secretion system PorP/SprF family membrane protein [Flavobacteriales bacterium]|jgi:type IX secretion system PorP/SprF family membrane protein